MYLLAFNSYKFFNANIFVTRVTTVTIIYFKTPKTKINSNL